MWPLVKHENNRGQRVNVPAALAAFGPTPQDPPRWQTAARTWKSEDVKAFLQDSLPGATSNGNPGQCPHPLPWSHADGTYRTGGAADQLKFPANYAPELNLIEHTFRRSKHNGLAPRTYTDAAALTRAVDQALQDIKAHLISKL